MKALLLFTFTLNMKYVIEP